jgi:hypothetical protein
MPDIYWLIGSEEGTAHYWILSEGVRRVRQKRSDR